MSNTLERRERRERERERERERVRGIRKEDSSIQGAAYSITITAAV